LFRPFQELYFFKFNNDDDASSKINLFFFGEDPTAPGLMEFVQEMTNWKNLKQDWTDKVKTNSF
jgi:hypothetical protein